MTGFRSPTHEMRAFWRSWGHGHPRDAEIRRAEFYDLPIRTSNALARSGFTCRDQVAACPDWLLATVTEIGRHSVQVIRKVIPFGTLRDGHCPGDLIENERWRARRAEMTQARMAARRRKAG